MAVARVLDTSARNRALLARQLLLERSNLSLPRALERIAGIQAQYAPSMYVGLWSRLAGFERPALTRALERRTVVQGTLMRSTIHLVSARDYWPLALAVRETRRTWYLRSRKQATAKSMERAAQAVRSRLAGGQLRRAELTEVAGGDAEGVGLWVDLVRAPPSGTWERRRADIFAGADDWLEPPDVAPGEAGAYLVRRYLQGFGPASRKEIASWSGLALRTLDEVLGEIELRRFTAEDGAELLDLPRLPLPDPRTPAPVRFLPTWDASLLVHARGSGVLREEHRPLIFTSKNPQSLGTFLVDGTVAGTWRPTDAGVAWSAFEPLAARDRRAVADEAERLTDFHAAE